MMNEDTGTEPVANTAPLNFANAQPGDSLVDDETLAQLQAEQSAAITEENSGESTVSEDAVTTTETQEAEAQGQAQTEASVDTTEAPVVETTNQTDPVAGSAVATETATETTPVAAAVVDVEVHLTVEADTVTDSLIAEKEALEAKITARQKEKQSLAIAEIKTVVDAYHIPIQDLIDGLGGMPKNTRKGTKAPIKYRDASGNTWTGRGKAPAWIKDKNKEDFLVK